MTPSELDAYLRECRQLTLDEIREIVPDNERCGSALYDLMLDYPLRASKALRPALCIATCRALGGSLQAVLRSAAILELYHNAFLIHDDVEDCSENRRDAPTLHWTHGAPIAVNVGDAMLALALQPLLDNMRLIGLGKALRILQAVARMARESAEGQALELNWIRHAQWQLTDTDYLRMVYKKTSWYSFITPMLVGGTVAGMVPERQREVRKFAALLGIAFQIQDDVLNLVGEGEAYGKEIGGDLWEGKRTLILLHALRTASASERQHACNILRKPRPIGRSPDARPGRAAEPPQRNVARLIETLHAQGELTAAAKRVLVDALDDGPIVSMRGAKSEADIAFLMALIARCRSLDYARSVAQQYGQKAARILAAADWLPPSVHRDFIAGLVSFVVTRDR